MISLKGPEYYSQYMNEKERRKIISPINSNKKLGRNDLCYCGSNKKYKYCHLNKRKQLLLFRLIKRLWKKIIN